MANDLSANPWKLDTPGASVVYAYPVKIQNINWANYTLAATTGNAALVIQDSNGKDIVNVNFTNTTATVVPGIPFNTGLVGWVRGIKITTLSSAGGSAGEVTIAIGAGK